MSKEQQAAVRALHRRPDWDKHVNDAYKTLRAYNSSIPDDVLDTMLEILRARDDAAVQAQGDAKPEWMKCRMVNMPHPRESGMRVLGFVVPDNGAPLGMVSERLSEIIGSPPLQSPPVSDKVTKAPEVVGDYALLVYAALSIKGHSRTGQENVDDVLEAIRALSQAERKGLVGKQPVSEAIANDWKRKYEGQAVLLSGAKLLNEKYSDVLRALCSWLSVGGFNSDGLISPETAEAKIRDGVDILLSGSAALSQPPAVEAPSEPFRHNNRKINGPAHAAGLLRSEAKNLISCMGEQRAIESGIHGSVELVAAYLASLPAPPLPMPQCGSRCPCDPSGSDGLTCPDPATGKLLCEDEAPLPKAEAASDERPAYARVLADAIHGLSRQAFLDMSHVRSATTEEFTRAIIERAAALAPSAAQPAREARHHENCPARYAPITEVDCECEAIAIAQGDCQPAQGTQAVPDEWRKAMTDMLRVLRSVEAGDDEQWKFIANVCSNADDILAEKFTPVSELAAQHIGTLGLEFFYGDREYAMACRASVANAVRAKFAAPKPPAVQDGGAE